LIASKYRIGFCWPNSAAVHSFIISNSIKERDNN
jgi:hypothetical protein